MAYTPLLIIPLVGLYDSFDTSCLHEFGVKSTLDKRSRVFIVTTACMSTGTRHGLQWGSSITPTKKIK